MASTFVRFVRPFAAPAALALTLTSSSLGCDEEPAQTEQHDTERGALLVVVTVDWEGRDLSETNLAAMEGLRARFPEVPLVQFLNAAYYTKSGADPADVTRRIERALLPADELGLHIHGWKSLFEASGVTFRDTPTFWEEEGKVTSCFSDCGHEVPISAYGVDELRSVIRFSSDTLETAGFGRPTSFRAGGWMAAPQVQDALAFEGFLTENSAVPAGFLASEIGDLPLHGWVSELWKDTTERSQPYGLETEGGLLIEIPDNGALADYMTADEMFDVYAACKGTWQADERADIVVSIGFHQETAAKFVPRVEAALEKIVADAEADGLPITFVTASEVADRLTR